MEKIDWKVSRKKRVTRTSKSGRNPRQELSGEVSVPKQILKALLVTYVVTGALLMILAFLLYRFHLSENVIVIGILLIYIAATFAGGFFLGKSVKVKKYFWGMILGMFYVALLLLITLGVYRTLNNGDIVTILVLCTCSGTLGGMLS